MDNEEVVEVKPSTSTSVESTDLGISANTSNSEQSEIKTELDIDRDLDKSLDIEPTNPTDGSDVKLSDERTLHESEKEAKSKDSDLSEKLDFDTAHEEEPSSVENIQQLEELWKKIYEVIPKIEGQNIIEAIDEVKPLLELIKGKNQAMLNLFKRITTFFLGQQRNEDEGDDTYWQHHNRAPPASNITSKMPHHIRFDSDDEERFQEPPMKKFRHVGDQRGQDVTQIKNENKELNRKWEQLSREFQRERREKEQLNAKYENSMHALNSFKLKSDAEVNNLKRQLNVCNKEISDLTSRLSREMGSKMASDESSLENVSIKNRPMNVADNYQMFCSNEWLDAKTVLDEKCENTTELDKLRLVGHILMVTEQEVFMAHRKIIEKIHAPLSRLRDPMSLLDDIQIGAHTDTKRGRPGRAKQESSYTAGKQSSSKTSDVPLELQNIIADMLRKQSDNMDVEQLLQLVYKNMEISSRKRGKSDERFLTLWPTVAQESGMKKFVKKTCEIAWQMAIQRPQMVFKSPGIGESWKGDSLQEIIWGSADPNDKKNVVGCYVYPLLYHGDRLMAKGRVYMVKPSLYK